MVQEGLQRFGLFESDLNQRAATLESAREPLNPESAGKGVRAKVNSALFCPTRARQSKTLVFLSRACHAYRPMITFIAWAWSGHISLTTWGLSFAISHFVSVASPTVASWFKRYTKDDSVSSSNQLASEIDTSFKSLPFQVAAQDLHPGNLPYIGEFLQKDSQVRHFMRNHKDTSVQSAFNSSYDYVFENLREAGVLMASSVAQTKGEGLDQSRQRFREGIFRLARSLHPIEDSYAPAHVSRNRKTGDIDFIFYWGDKSELKSHGLNATHGQLDNPQDPYSQPYFDAARASTGEIILILLNDLDKDETLLSDDLRRYMSKNFRLVNTQPARP